MAITLEQWKQKVLGQHPTAEFTLEDGSGVSYGEEGDWTAHTGPDMQADVVGVYNPESGGWYLKGDDMLDAETDLPEFDL